MSCNSNCSGNEPMTSIMDNLILQLFGAITKSVDQWGRWTWNAPCSVEQEIPGYPKNDSEGFICYLIRIFKTIGMVFEGEWSNVTTYGVNSIVSYSYALYRAKIENTNYAPNTNPDVWELMIEGIAGPQGPAGPAGPPSQPSMAPTTVTSDVTLTNNEEFLLCKPTASTVVTLPLQADLFDGKYYYFQTNGLFPVIITPTAPETIKGHATYELRFDTESVHVISGGDGNWRVL